MRFPLRSRWLTHVACSRTGNNLLYASDTLCPSVNVCCDILVDALEGDTVVAEMRGRREVEIMYVSSETGSEPDGNGGLEMAYLKESIIWMDGDKGGGGAHHRVGIYAWDGESEP